MRDMAELWQMGAADLATAIRDREVSSREVVEAHLARIEAVNGTLNAVTTVLSGDAVRTADEADRALADGDPPGPLHGVPMTVKENIDLEGSPTTQALVAMADAIAPVDAPHIAQLRAAGAIPIARTNLPDFGLRWHTDNDLRGPTKNPWDDSVTPGGSSGGDACALATGMTPLGMGNDYGGSLRWPSQCCGTAALKPTFGRVPYASAFDPQDGPLTLQMFAVQGPMARHVRDLRLAFNSMTAPDPRDPWYTPAPLVGPEVPRRVAIVTDPGGEGVDSRVAAGVQRAAEALKDAGYEVEEAEPPLVAQARDEWAKLVVAEIVHGLMPQVRPILGSDAVRFLDTIIDAVGGATDYGGYMSGFIGRHGIARAWSSFFADYPLILGPVGTIQPFEVGFDLAGQEEVLEVLRGMRLVVAVNLLGLPTAVVPVGVDGSLPQGVQIIGNRYREDLCLDAAEAIEERLGVVTPIDPK